MKSKLLLLILTTIACISALFSCQFPPVNTGGNNKDNETADYKAIIYADEDLDLIDVRGALSDIAGSIVRVSPDSEAAIDGEIVFGNTNRQVTAAAKAALEKELAKSDGYDAGYIFYCDGKNIAVYWTLDEMELLAIPKFVEECLSGSEVTGEKGVIFTEFYKKDEFERDKAWALIEANATPDVVAALKELYGFYDGTMLAGWCANLYDPEIGGFYYSISARDNPGYLPDMESTSQLLSVMVSNGAFKNRNTALPEEIKAKIVNFIKNNQSPVDGYFYHPQWPQDKNLLATDRYGRDQGWATGLINSFTHDTDGDGVQEKQYPKYCITMKGLKCEKHTGTDEKCIFPISEAQQLTSAAVSDTKGLTDVIGVSVSSAVSKVREGASSVIAAATVSSHPDYSSREAFKTWLYQYNDPEKIKESSGAAHNLSAIKDEIIAHGMFDILLDQLDEVQAELFVEMQENGETPTGLWQRNVDYKAVWGLLKYMSIYNSSQGREIKVEYLPYIIETCIKVIQLPPSDDYRMNDLYNQWTGITSLISNVKKHNPGSEQIIYDIIRANSAPLISNSLAKIENFRIADGSIGYTPGGISLPKIYGVPISLGIHEGDVNAVSLCCSMYRAICECLGYTAVPIFTEADGKMFVETLVNSEPIVKGEIEFGEIDFEDDSMGGLAFSKGTGNATAEVVEDPYDSSNKALYFTSPGLTSGSGGVINASPLTVGSGCNIFETRMYVESTDSANYLMQITLVQELYMITLHRSGNNIEIRETTTASSGAKHNKIATVPMNKWFSLRIEYYEAEEDSEDGKPHIKVWVNEELKLNDSQFYYNSHLGATPGTIFNGVELRSMRAAGTYIYLDNVYCSKESKTFDPDDSTISDSRDN